MISLTYKEKRSFENQKVYYTCKKGFSTDNEKNIIKEEIIAIT